MSLLSFLRRKRNKILKRNLLLLRTPLPLKRTRFRMLASPLLTRNNMRTCYVSSCTRNLPNGYVLLTRLICLVARLSLGDRSWCLWVESMRFSSFWWFSMVRIILTSLVIATTCMTFLFLVICRWELIIQLITLIYAILLFSAMTKKEV